MAVNKLQAAINFYPKIYLAKQSNRIGYFEGFDKVAAYLVIKM